MRLKSALQLVYSVAGYYGVTFLLGAVSSLLTDDMEDAFERFWIVGLGSSVLPHALFLYSLRFRGGWLDYGAVIGVLTAILIVILTLRGWPRNAVFIGLLLVAACYGLWAAGPA